MKISVKSFIEWTDEADSKSRRFHKSMTKALRGASAYLWRVAKNSIKTKTRKVKSSYIDEHGRLREFEKFVASPPGEPPYSHQRGATWKKSFHFAVDEETMTAYVGPIQGRKGIAPVLEYGLHDTVSWKVFQGDHLERRSKIVKYKPRPTMAKALKKSKPYLSKYWSQVFTS